MRLFLIPAILGLTSLGLLHAQTETNIPTALPILPTSDSTNAPAAVGADTNTASIVPVPTAPAITTPAPEPTPAIAAPAPVPPTPFIESTAPTAPSITDSPVWPVLAALVTLGSLAGFLLYYCGLTRARNCAHTSTLLVVGTIFGLLGYWLGGFAVQCGGMGDAHSALTGAGISASKDGLNHELGFLVAGHYWGLMGNSGFFLDADPGSGVAALFLAQAALLALAVAAALGASLERGKIVAMAIVAFVTGTLIYPLFANWTWGGGWLAGLGRDFGLGHGFVDLAGAGVVHETAGTLAFVVAVFLGPRSDRFGRDKSTRPIPGHNVPFVLLGALVLLLSWSAAGVLTTTGTSAAVAAVNILLAAGGAFVVSFFHAAWLRRRPEPALLCRGLLGGAVAGSGCSALVDPWAGFVIGLGAGALIPAALASLEKKRIDDPVGSTAVHGACGIWGVLATGLFANGALSASGINGVDGPVRGLLFGGAWHQLAAQVIGAVTCFVVVFVLGSATLTLIQKILGVRVPLADETAGLDWPQTGALGYQPDAEAEESKREE